MMGKSHTLTGLILWPALAPALITAATWSTRLVDAETLPAVTLAALATSTAVAGGAANLPDADTRGMMTRMYGPVGAVMSRIIAAVFGGHRQGTHSLLFAALAGSAAEASLMYRPAMALTVGFFVGVACRGLGIGRTRDETMIALTVTVATAAAVYWTPLPAVAYWWLGPAVTVGCITHCLGDGCTPEGWPALWPWRRERYEMVLLRRTGNLAETAVVRPLLRVAVAVVWAWRLGVLGPVWLAFGVPAARWAATQLAG